MTVIYQGSKSTLPHGVGTSVEIQGGAGNGSNSDAGSIQITAGLVDDSLDTTGGTGGGITITATDSVAYITSPATPGALFVSFTTSIAGTDSTGLSNDATVYDVKLTFDPGADNVLQTVSIVGSTAQTFDDLLAQIDLQIGQSYQDATFTGPIAPADPTGLANDATVYTFTTQFDSQPVTHIVSVTGSAAQTFGALVIAINASMVGGTASIVGGNLRIKSSGLTPPVVIGVVFDNTLFGAITPNTFTGFNPAVTALGITTFPASFFLQILSNGCGGFCFGTNSNVLDGGADVGTYLFGALNNFSGPTSSSAGNNASYSQEDGASVFVKAGNSGGTGIGGDPYGGPDQAGSVTILAGNAPSSGPQGNSRENGGMVDIRAGQGGGREARGGHINMVAGSTGSGAVKGGRAGSVTLFAGSATGNLNSDIGFGGNVELTAGNGGVGGNAGDMLLSTGVADGSTGFIDEDYSNSPFAITGTTLTGLGAGTYDVSFSIDGAAPVVVTLTPGTAFPTFQDVIDALNSQLSGVATAVILPGFFNGKIRIRSTTFSHTSVVVDNGASVGTYLFGALAQFQLTETPQFGGDPIGGSLEIEIERTGQFYLKASGGIREVAGLNGSGHGFSATKRFSCINTDNGGTNENVTCVTGTMFTVDATPVVFQYDEITETTVTKRGSIPVDVLSLYAFKLMVSAMNSTSTPPATDFATWHIEGAIARTNSNAASTVIVGATSSVKRDSGTLNVAGWTLTVTADTTLGGLIITITTPAFDGTSVAVGIDFEMIKQR